MGDRKPKTPYPLRFGIVWGPSRWAMGGIALAVILSALPMTGRMIGTPAKAETLYRLAFTSKKAATEKADAAMAEEKAKASETGKTANDTEGQKSTVETLDSKPASSETKPAAPELVRAPEAEKATKPAPSAPKTKSVGTAAKGDEAAGKTAKTSKTTMVAVAPAPRKLPKPKALTPEEYEKARWDPIHFPPAIENATDDQCLACHQEILTRKPRPVSPAGLKASDVLAWYQTLDTYAGPQETFHARHLTTPFARKVMNLTCNFCHQGNDPREEAPGSHAEAKDTGAFTLRKTVNPSKTCLRCHGKFPFEFMDGVDGPWPQVRQDLEDEETPNGCLTCHAESFRTVRHQVTYLNPEAIEAAAKTSSDVCYGCHGGRQWYRISYPYPRNPWPGMADIVGEETPEWAKNRPTESEARYRRKQK